MSTNATTGGFVGDPAEAFTPPSASGCCGGAFTASEQTAGAGGCCGNAESTTANEAETGTGCCG